MSARNLLASRVRNKKYRGVSIRSMQDIGMLECCKTAYVPCVEGNRVVLTTVYGVTRVI